MAPDQFNSVFNNMLCNLLIMNINQQFETMDDSIKSVNKTRANNILFRKPVLYKDKEILNLSMLQRYKTHLCNAINIIYLTDCDLSQIEEYESLKYFHDKQTLTQLIGYLSYLQNFYALKSIMYSLGYNFTVPAHDKDPIFLISYQDVLKMDSLAWVKALKKHFYIKNYQQQNEVWRNTTGNDKELENERLCEMICEKVALRMGKHCYGKSFHADLWSWEYLEPKFAFLNEESQMFCQRTIEDVGQKMCNMTSCIGKDTSVCVTHCGIEGSNLKSYPYIFLFGDQNEVHVLCKGKLSVFQRFIANESQRGLRF